MSLRTTAAATVTATAAAATTSGSIGTARAGVILWQFEAITRDILKHVKGAVASEVCTWTSKVIQAIHSLGICVIECTVRNCSYRQQCQYSKRYLGWANIIKIWQGVETYSSTVWQ